MKACRNSALLIFKPPSLKLSNYETNETASPSGLLWETPPI
jgi:hypothetical protein